MARYGTDYGSFGNRGYSAGGGGRGGYGGSPYGGGYDRGGSYPRGGGYGDDRDLGDQLREGWNTLRRGVRRAFGGGGPDRGGYGGRGGEGGQRGGMGRQGAFRGRGPAYDTYFRRDFMTNQGDFNPEFGGGEDYGYRGTSMRGRMQGGPSGGMGRPGGGQGGRGRGGFGGAPRGDRVSYGPGYGERWETTLPEDIARRNFEGR
ncbi:MAG TPA: hypothetical protein VGR37_24625 [Longimicrobiaceae bacterium]|nr:hypothetical protein [Longimicrobiaceae bacterium]